MIAKIYEKISYKTKSILFHLRIIKGTEYDIPYQLFLRRDWILFSTFLKLSDIFIEFLKRNNIDIHINEKDYKMYVWHDTDIKIIQELLEICDVNYYVTNQEVRLWLKENDILTIDFGTHHINFLKKEDIMRTKLIFNMQKSNPYTESIRIC
jgi:hypothetical protein